MTAAQSPRKSLDNPDVERATETTDTETITKETESTETTETAAENVEYPSAFPLALITMAVMFSVFLTALDQVSLSSKKALKSN
jgi:hypothetical protein